MTPFYTDNISHIKQNRKTWLTDMIFMQNSQNLSPLSIKWMGALINIDFLSGN